MSATPYVILPNEDGADDRAVSVVDLLYVSNPVQLGDRQWLVSWGYKADTPSETGRQLPDRSASVETEKQAQEIHAALLVGWQAWERARLDVGGG